jgi:hypothetical protein
LLSGSLTLISCVNFDQTRAVVAYSLFVLPPTAATRYAFAVMLLVRKRLTATSSVPDVIARQSGADYALSVWSRKRGYGTQQSAIAVLGQSTAARKRVESAIVRTDRWLGLESVAICRVSNQFPTQG